MELKTNETNYSDNTETEKAYPNPNDALFGMQDMDDAYHIKDVSSSYQKEKSDPKKIIYAVFGIIIALGAIFGVYRNNHKYDGMYNMVEVETQGYSVTVEELNALSGYDVYGSLDINGRNCYVILNSGFTSTKGNAKIEFDGNNVSLEASDGILKGKYNPQDKTIALTFEGNVNSTYVSGTLVFKKAD